MNTLEINDLITDAKLALDAIENSKSPVFRKAAAEWLKSIAEQLQAALTKSDDGETAAADPDRPVIDFAMKYRTRDGREVTGLRFDGIGVYPCIGYTGGVYRSWTTRGHRVDDTSTHPLDLIPTGELA